MPLKRFKEKHEFEEDEIAKIGEEILLEGKHKMIVLAVHNNSVVAEFIQYPVPGEEERFEDRRTVINHSRYTRLDG